MTKINVFLDKFLIGQKDLQELKELLKNCEAKVDISEGDTHATGGMSWFPTDLIIVAFGLTASGFLAALGKDLYKKLKQKLITILKRPNGISHFYLAFDLSFLQFYFEVSLVYSKDPNYAIDKILTDFSIIVQEAKRIKKMRLKSIGKFESITYFFNEEEDRWLIKHFNNFRW